MPDDKNYGIKTSPKYNSKQIAKDDKYDDIENDKKKKDKSCLFI